MVAQCSMSITIRDIQKFGKKKEHGGKMGTRKGPSFFLKKMGDKRKAGNEIC